MGSHHASEMNWGTPLYDLFKHFRVEFRTKCVVTFVSKNGRFAEFPMFDIPGDNLDE